MCKNWVPALGMFYRDHSICAHVCTCIYMYVCMYCIHVSMHDTSVRNEPNTFGSSQTRLVRPNPFGVLRSGPNRSSQTCHWCLNVLALLLFTERLYGCTYGSIHVWSSYCRNMPSATHVWLEWLLQKHAKCHPFTWYCNKVYINRVVSVETCHVQKLSACT